MPRKSSLSVARSHILDHFRCSTRKIFKQSELGGILEQHRAEWHLAASTSLQDFARFLISEGELQEVTLGSEHYINKKAQRFSWGVPSPYELALSLRSGAYLCHATAMFMHGLTDATAHTVYVNLEQSPKPAPSGNLTAASIKAAFARKQRESQLSYRRGEWTLVVVNGKNTGRLGVTSMRGPSDARLDATNLERTLIDIAVRPSYAGNIAHVQEAYNRARGKVSIERLVSTLQQLEYVYPYHQAVGYLLEQAGYHQREFEQLRDRDRGFGLEHDFYLTHGMSCPSYDASWRLFIPNGS